MNEHIQTPPLITRGQTQGTIYLKGFADGYHRRPRVIQLTMKAQAAYAKGYNAGKQAREDIRKG